MIIVFVMTENGISLLFPKIRFLNIPLKIKWLGYQHALGTEIAISLDSEKSFKVGWR
jgi:hypothetical protein